MSLVGSLEELGLGDLLQVVSLARKSGLLRLRGEAGDAHVAFRDGRVHAAWVAGDPTDLRGLLLAGGFVRPAELAAAVDERGLSVEQAAAELADLTSERLDALRRENVERAVFQVFAWTSGEFSFEVGEEIAEWEGELALAHGLNAQYLLMEATRLRDEAGRAPRVRNAASAEAPAPELAGESVGPSDLDAPRFSGEVGLDEPQSPPASTGEDGAKGRRDAADEPERRPAPARTGAVVPAALLGGRAGLVAIHPSLPVLEWIKGTVRGTFGRVHLFQTSEGGVTRIRQYLARGELPVVLISVATPADPLNGISSVADLLRRLRAQAPAMRIVLCREPGEGEPRFARHADAVVEVPAPGTLGERRQGAAAGRLSEGLRVALERCAA